MRVTILYLTRPDRAPLVRARRQSEGTLVGGQKCRNPIGVIPLQTAHKERHLFRLPGLPGDWSTTQHKVEV